MCNFISDSDLYIDSVLTANGWTNIDTSDQEMLQDLLANSNCQLGTVLNMEVRNTVKLVLKTTFEQQSRVNKVQSKTSRTNLHSNRH
jgi:hypothetical protein